jgi:hypothetical protein
MGLDGSVLRCSWYQALLLLYCCFTAVGVPCLTASCLDAAGIRFYCCFTAALLLRYSCATAALLLLYCGISCVTLAAGHWQLTAALQPLYYCFTAAALRYQLRDTGSGALAADAIRVTEAALLQLSHALLQLTLYA